MLASSLGISSWTPLKPQHSNPNPNPLANQLRCIDFHTPPTPLIIPHRLPAFLESLMPRKNWCSIYARWSKSSLNHSIRFCGIFPSLKENFIAYRSSKVSSHPNCIFEIHQLWQSDFSRMYSNCCCSRSFEAEIIKIGQSSHKMYSSNVLNFQNSKLISILGVIRYRTHDSFHWTGWYICWVIKQLTIMNAPSKPIRQHLNGGCDHSHRSDWQTVGPG